MSEDSSEDSRDDMYEIDHDQRASFFGHTGKGTRNMFSKIMVEDLLKDRDLLALFYVVSTWNDIGWYRFSNMDDLVPNSEAYWRQLDLNRISHTYHPVLGAEGTRGSHFGDCTHMACSCYRCGAEFTYLETVYLKDLAAKQDISSTTLLAILLSRDQSLVSHKDHFDEEMTPTNEDEKKDKEAHLMEWIDAANAKYPRERGISMKRYIDHWVGLSDQEINFFISRAGQIRAWCDEH